MRHLASVVVALVAAAFPALAADAGISPSRQITSLARIHALDNAEASHNLRVAFEGTVTFYRKGNVDLFVQDGDAAVYVEASADLNLVFGDRVLITGYTEASFRPQIKAESVRFLRHDGAPKPVPATFPELIRGDLDCLRVSAHGIVLSANVVSDVGTHNLYLQLLMDDGSIDVEAPDDNSIMPANLLDAEVEVTGAVAGKFDGKTQLTGILLQVPSLDGIRILKPAAAQPSSLPVTPMDEIIKNYDVEDRSKRVRIQGTVTYYQPGAALVLQNGAKSLWVMTQYEQPLAIGQQVDVTGFPSVRSGSLALIRGEVEDRGANTPLEPAKLTAAELEDNSHAFDLVSVEGKLLMAVRDSGQDQYVLVSNGHLYSAILRHPERGFESQLRPFKKVDVGSTVRMTGICVVENGDRYLGPVAFEVLLRSTEDVAVIAGPSLLSVRNLIAVVVFLLLVILAAAARQWLIERRMRHQTVEQAYGEQRRSRILEDINSSRPLPEVMDRITELVSFRLRGAPCWCDLAEGSEFGNRPGEFTGLRIIEFPVRNSAGVVLGVLRAALHELTRPASIEEPTLSMAAALVTLAVETNRLYSDLVKRSEFDLLTGIHNRFSFEKRLSQLLEEHARAGTAFGLIYVDLDGFKQLNDQYGHQVGDLYLQAAAARMKNQIRPSDMLARIGGDEFTVLVPAVAHREDVFEIAHRIRECFEQRFSIENQNLDGTASLGIAFYPEDGGTKDDLLNAADAAMYAEKNRRKNPPRLQACV